MARVLLVLFALLALGLTAGPALGQEHPPRVNPLTGKPYGPKALAEYEAAIKQQKAEEEAARAASEEAEQRWQEARARNAEQIRAFDEAIEDWQEENPPPAGTEESLVSTSYDNDTALGERAEITYYNNWDVPTHKVQFGPDGKPTGPVTLTQQGKAWETIGPRIPPGGGVEISYGEDFDGNEIITEARIFDAGGRSLQSYDFNFDGIPWRGETRDPETGLRNGGFLDDRFKPPPRTMGGPLAVPPTVRLITGVCEPCRDLASEHNDLANEINTIIAEMASLSREHMQAYPPAQKAIRMRHEVLEKRLAELMARFEALRARLLDCERQCRPQAQTPAGDGPQLARPAFQTVPDLAPPASFCSETERVGWLNTVYNPAVAAALANATTAQDHQARLNALFTEHMRANSPWWGQVRAERDAFEPVAAETIVSAEALRGMYPAILAVPITACPDQPQVATGAEPVTDPAVAVGETPATVVSAGTSGKPPCPPKEGRQPITVGANSKVGSGARLRAKVGGMAMGALAGALGAGGGGGGGGSDGPDLWTCKIKESEYTVFDDPATGVSLRVGAKRAKGGKVVIFSEIARSPDKGTFQTAFLENPMTGETQAPGDVGPCDLWGEWKLTVSWTKTTYVDGQMVSQESGGWQETGRFSIPGVLSKVDAPDGLWKRMGFSNASNGAREIGMIYDVPPGGGPLTFVIHVTRPRGDPVTTVPFVLTMTEGPNGFVFTKAEDPPCPPGPMTVSTGGQPAEVIAESSRGSIVSTPPDPGAPPAPPPPGDRGVVNQRDESSPDGLRSWTQAVQDDLGRQLDDLASTDCDEGEDRWYDKQSRLLQALGDYERRLGRVNPVGPDASQVETVLGTRRLEAKAIRDQISKLKPPPCPSEAAPASVTSTPQADGADPELDRHAMRVVDTWREEDADSLTRMKAGQCDPALRERILKRIEARREMIRQSSGMEYIGAMVRAGQIDGPRMDQLEALLGEADKPCPTVPDSMTWAPGTYEPAAPGMTWAPGTYETTAPAPPTQPDRDPIIEAAAKAYVDASRDGDREMLRRIESSECDPALRAKFVQNLKDRIKAAESGGGFVSQVVQRAMEIDGERVAALLIALDTDDVCPMPAAAAEKAREAFEAAPGPYTPRPDDEPDDDPM